MVDIGVADGEVVLNGLAAADEQEQGHKEGRRRRKPEACRRYLRQQTEGAWDAIVKSLVGKAKEGSVPHVTLLAKLSGIGEGAAATSEPKRREKSLAQQLREQMEELQARNIAEFGE